MAKKIRAVPKAYGSITPYLIVKGAAQAIAFYKKAFGAEERMRMGGDDGAPVMHAEIQLGDSVVMLADEFPDMGITGPGEGGTAVSILHYVEDVDKVFKKAVKAGAKVVRPVADQFYGDRSGTLRDPFGHTWNLASHVEDVSDTQLMERLEKMSAACSEAEEHHDCAGHEGGSGKKTKAKPSAKAKGKAKAGRSRKK